MSDGDGDGSRGGKEGDRREAEAGSHGLEEGEGVSGKPSCFNFKDDLTLDSAKTLH